jgi:paxillin
VYCEKHYYVKQNLICATCEQPLLGGQMISMGTKNYHLDHFVCRYCRKELAGSEYYELDNQPHCSRCYLRFV